MGRDRVPQKHNVQYYSMTVKLLYLELSWHIHIITQCICMMQAITQTDGALYGDIIVSLPQEY